MRKKEITLGVWASAASSKAYSWCWRWVSSSPPPPPSAEPSLPLTWTPLPHSSWSWNLMNWGGKGRRSQILHKRLLGNSEESSENPKDSSRGYDDFLWPTCHPFSFSSSCPCHHLCPCPSLSLCHHPSYPWSPLLLPPSFLSSLLPSFPSFLSPHHCPPHHCPGLCLLSSYWLLLLSSSWEAHPRFHPHHHCHHVSWPASSCLLLYAPWELRLPPHRPHHHHHHWPVFCLVLVPLRLLFLPPASCSLSSEWHHLCKPHDWYSEHLIRLSTFHRCYKEVRWTAVLFTHRHFHLNLRLSRCQLRKNTKTHNQKENNTIK